VFDDLLGPSKVELARHFRELVIDFKCFEGAIFTLLVEKGILGYDDKRRLSVLRTQIKCVLDQELAKATDELRVADTPEGERFRRQEGIAKTFGKFFESFVDPPTEDNDKED